jgi:hypothetical protein
MLELPEEAIRWRDPRLRPAWAALLLAAALGLLFLPRVLTNSDEIYYAGQARTMLRGRLVPVAGDPLPVVPGEEAAAVKVPPGWPAVLMLGGGLRGMFVVALLVHLLGAAAAARMLLRRGAPPVLVVAYLFHPSLFVYSHTLMSDVPMTAALVVAADAWENRRKGAWAVAAAILLRFAGVVAAAGMALAARPRLRMLIPAGIAVAALFAFNHAVHGTWTFTTPRAQAGFELLGAGGLAENLLLYGGGLLLLPPFPLVWVVLRRRDVDRWALAALPIVLFFLCYNYHDRSPRWWETLVGGQRLILPAHALLMMATARVWSAPVLFRRSGLLLAAGLAAGVAGSLAMRQLAAPYRPVVDALAGCRRIGFDAESARVALSVPAGEYHLMPADVDAAVLSDRAVTHSAGDIPTFSVVGSCQRPPQDFAHH